MMESTDKKTPTVINIISSKGGSGKSLLTAVFATILRKEGYKVLVIDLDIFVRGITALYNSVSGAEKFTEIGTHAVSEFLLASVTSRPADMILSIIEGKMHFDISPAVPRFKDHINMSELPHLDITALEGVLVNMLSTIPNDKKNGYDVIFIDNRAGYDNFVAASHLVSNFSICVEEDDIISNVATEGLILSLKGVDNRNNFYRVVNKVRHEQSDKNPRDSYLHDIPFDMDILNSYGYPSFWDDVSDLEYYKAAFSALHDLIKKEKLSYKLKNEVVVFNAFTRNLSTLSSSERVRFIYGLIVIVMSSIIIFAGSELLSTFDPIRLFASLSALVGVTMVFLSVYKTRRKTGKNNR